MPKQMEISIIGNVIELRREQWKGKVARITNDSALLEEVKKYTWTYKDGEHPYLHNSKLNLYFHEFVLGFIYGAENIHRMQSEGNIIEHLDNDGLNCTYSNLHILSEDLNKAKAFTIDKKAAELDRSKEYPSYIMDVYYLHDSKQFQLQLFMNDDIYFNKNTGKAAEMFICMYDKFENLYIDWFYLLNSRSDRRFEVGTLHAKKVFVTERPTIEIQEGEENKPFIIRNGVRYLNLDATSNGKPMVSLQHTSMRIVFDDIK